MARIEIYSKGWCPYCMAAKRLLARKGLPFTEIDVEKTPAQLEHMIRRSERRTVPQIFIDNVHLGGANELMAAERSGALDSATAAIRTA